MPSSSLSPPFGSQPLLLLLSLLLCFLSVCNAEVCHICGNPNHVVRNPDAKVQIPPNSFIDLSEVTCAQIYDQGKKGTLPGFACDLAKTRPEVQDPCDCGPPPRPPNAPPAPSPPPMDYDACAGGWLSCTFDSVIAFFLNLFISGTLLFNNIWNTFTGGGGGGEATRQLLRVAAAVQNNN